MHAPDTPNMLAQNDLIFQGFAFPPNSGGLDRLFSYHIDRLQEQGRLSYLLKSYMSSGPAPITALETLTSQTPFGFLASTLLSTSYFISLKG
jgi:hypothetical protein